jgi:hypothetical protein
MKTQTISKTVLTFLLFMILQLLVFRNIVIQDYAFCFMYIAISFLVGLIIDIFYDTAGVHASACVLISYLRTYIVQFLFPNRGLETDVVLSINGMGTERFVRYIFIMTLIHHTLLFFVEAGTFQFFVVTIIKIVSSVLVTTFTIVLLHVVFRGVQHR